MPLKSFDQMIAFCINGKAVVHLFRAVFFWGGCDSVAVQVQLDIMHDPHLLISELCGVFVCQASHGNSESLFLWLIVLHIRPIISTLGFRNQSWTVGTPLSNHRYWRACASRHRGSAHHVKLCNITESSIRLLRSCHHRDSGRRPATPCMTCPRWMSSYRGSVHTPASIRKTP